ncbi:MAG: glycosyltransferase [Caulobacteraceae bacterium]|nr:glycosyltransferase [Caulobacteraceae bacterium]
MPRRVLIVSPHFPPSSLAGVHRARHLGKHLPAAGWTPTVLCVDEVYHEERLDPELAALVPAGLEVVKAPAVPARLTRPFGLGDVSLRGWRPLRRAVLGRIAAGGVDAVLITGAPYYPMLLAAEIRRQGTPVVLDFQDPWASAWGARQPLASKAGMSHRLAVNLEPRALRWASFVTSVSEVQNGELADRYPWLDRDRMAAIPIGGDPDDYAAVSRSGAGSGGLVLDERCFNLTYAGTIAAGMTGTAGALMGALARLREAAPAAYRKLRVNFVGTSANPAGFRDFRVQALAQAAGVADVVREIPQRLPYLEVLRLQARSDGVLVLGSDAPHYTASKIFGILMSRRPFLSLFHQASSAHEILAKAGGGIALAFAGEADLASCEPRLAEALLQLVSNPAALGEPRRCAYAAYEASAIAQRFADVFEQVAYGGMGGLGEVRQLPSRPNIFQEPRA